MIINNIDFFLKLLQDIYDSEVNFKISSPCWDGGFTVAINPSGPYDDAWLIEETSIYGIENAIDRLVRLIIEHYPDSSFSKKYTTMGFKS